MAVLGKVDNLTAPMIELKAQVEYRQEKYSDALASYKLLLATHKDDFAAERVTNLYAAYAGAAAVAKDPMELTVEQVREPDTHEQLYNLATVALERGEPKEALKLLDRAQELCRRLVEDDPEYTEEDIEDELMLMEAQTLFTSK